MKTFLSAAIVMMPCMAFAAVDCRIIEYEDHFEAVCVGDAQQTPTPPGATEQERISEWEQNVAAVGVHQQEGDDSQVRVVRNDLAKLHAIQVTRSRQQ